MTYQILLILFLVISTLHYWPFQHWVFRTIEFAKIQLSFIQFLVLVVLAIQFQSLDKLTIVFGILLFGSWIHNLFILFHFTVFYPSESKTLETNTKPISFLSVNVYQYNTEYELLINLIKQLKPDILLTMESDIKWENALKEIEGLFSNYKKVSQDDTYGMHFYTKLNTENIKVNYNVAEDVPQIEADLKTHEGIQFKFFGVHPPPPSPTEEETSKERDADILVLAKKIKSLKKPCMVVGDFNNVAWSTSSKLFKKTAQLLDPRIGRGFISTFHAKYLFFRFPIDLIFHSKSIYVQKLKTEKAINSDHFPLYGEFVIKSDADKQQNKSTKPTQDEKEDIDEMIEDGKRTKSNNR